MKPKNREIEVCHPVVQGFTGSHSSSDVYRSVNRQALTLKIRVWTQVVAYKKANGGMNSKNLKYKKKDVKRSLKNNKIVRRCYASI